MHAPRTHRSRWLGAAAAAGVVILAPVGVASAAPAVTPAVDEADDGGEVSGCSSTDCLALQDRILIALGLQPGQPAAEDPDAVPVADDGEDSVPDPVPDPAEGEDPAPDEGEDPAEEPAEPPSSGDELSVGDTVTLSGSAGQFTATVTKVNDDGTVTLSLGEPSAENPDVTDEAGQVLALVNQAREEAGCDPLTADPALTQAAQDYAEAMAADVDAGTPVKTALSHEDADQNGPAERGEAAGATVTAENLAAGYETPEAAVAGWLASVGDPADPADGHAGTIVNCDLSVVGTGVATAQDGTVFWVQDFGPAPQGDSAPAATEPAGSTGG
jgi:uncharacterized protein YkwD